MAEELRNNKIESSQFQGSSPESIGYGWALYRFPDSDKVFFASGSTTEVQIQDEIKPSFVIAPFHNHQNTYWQIESKNDIPVDINNFQEAGLKLPFYFLPAGDETTPKKDYCQLVDDVLAEISAHKLHKAVPARTKHVSLSENFNAFKFYHSLLKSYPQAFVYMLSTPQTGTWVGCSPELLLKGMAGSVNTLALAGTRKIEAGNTPDLEEIFTWKEVDEQVIVTDYIQAILEKYCTGVERNGPELTKAGNVYHLATRFKATLKEEFNHKYGSLVQELHPTPAVCGFPLKESMQMLLEKEQFNRALYSGFLGPVSEKSADLFVNLRCMQLFEDGAQLYAGAGVVTGSDPEKEWLETEEKMNTLGRFV